MGTGGEETAAGLTLCLTVDVRVGVLATGLCLTLGLARVPALSAVVAADGSNTVSAT